MTREMHFHYSVIALPRRRAAFLLYLVAAARERGRKGWRKSTLIRMYNCLRDKFVSDESTTFLRDIEATRCGYAEELNPPVCDAQKQESFEQKPFAFHRKGGTPADDRSGTRVAARKAGPRMRAVVTAAGLLSIKMANYPANKPAGRRKPPRKRARTGWRQTPLAPRLLKKIS